MIFILSSHKGIIIFQQQIIRVGSIEGQGQIQINSYFIWNYLIIRFDFHIKMVTTGSNPFNLLYHFS